MASTDRPAAHRRRQPRTSSCSKAPRSRKARDQGDFLHREHIAQSAEQVAVQHVQRAVLSSAHERVSHRVARRQIREHRRAARTEISVVGVEARFIGGREELVDPERCGQLQQRIAVIVVGRSGVVGVEIAIARDTYT